MKTSSRISEAAISTAASVRPKAPCWWRRGWLLAVLVLQTLGAGTLLAVPAVQFTTGAESVDASAGSFSIPVTISPAPTATVSVFLTGSGAAQPRSGVFDAVGNYYVTFNNTNAQHEVYKFTPAGGVTIFTSNLLDYPASLAFDAAGNLYIVNAGGATPGTTVCKMTPAGVITVFASGFQRPNGLAFDAAGNLFVSSFGDSNIYKVTTTGTVSTFASGVTNCYGLAFDPSGVSLYCAIAAGRPAGVLKFHPLGSSTWFTTATSAATNLAFDPEGNLYVTNDNLHYPAAPFSGTVTKFTPDGNATILAGPENFSQPEGITYYAGNLYVTNSFNSSVVNKITLKTTVPYTLGGTAVSGVDYSGISSGTLSFGVGQTSGSLNGSLLTNPGPAKTLTFNLGTPDNGAVLGSPSTNTLTIVQPLRPSQLAIMAPAVTTIQQGAVTVAVTSTGFVPTGDVTLSVDGGALATAVLVNGQATFNVGTRSAGNHSLAASFAAQNGYSASTGSGTLTVNKAPSFLYLVKSPSVYSGQPIFIVANFGIGQGPGGSVPVQCYTDSSLTTPIPPPTNVGTYFATANFAGDATYLPTSLAESFTIAQAATRIDLSIAATNPNTGSPVAPTGVVTFVDDTFGAFGVFIDVGTASFPPAFTYYLASDTGFANPLAGPPSITGSYVVVANVAATANYKASTASASFTILPAVSLVVTTAVDEDDSNSDPTIGNGTSLREALRSAQSLSGPQTITFAPGFLGSVQLTQGAAGPLDDSALHITANIIIAADAGSQVILEIPNGNLRHFLVDSGASLTLRNLTVTGGHTTTYGGAIWSFGSVTVENCTFHSNTSLNESGAIHCWLPSQALNIVNSTFTRNSATFAGGAIVTGASANTLTFVTIADNTSVGGAYRQYETAATLVNTIIARNFNGSTPSDITTFGNGAFTAQSTHNLIGNGGAGNLVNGISGNQVGVAEPRLLPRGIYGSVSNVFQIMPPLASSPARAAGVAVSGVTTDQAGQTRTSPPDIGAIQFTNPDLDGDTLPDDWEFTYFANLQQDQNADADTDGFNNATEFLNGSNPNLAVSTPGTTYIARVFGPEPIDGLDLSGTFLYAFNVGTNGAAGQAGDANFTADNAPGITLSAPNEIANWSAPDFDAVPSPALDTLIAVYRSIRWANAGNPNPELRKIKVDLANLIPGQRYKLQLLFGENFSAHRVFDVFVNGALIVNDFITADAQGSTVMGIAGSAIVHEFIAPDTTLHIVLDGASVAAVPGLDPNPILNGVTLEAFPFVSPLAQWRTLHGLPANGSQDLANPSRDGVANLLKYAFNMAPNAGSLTTPNIAELPENGTAGLPFIYRDAQGRLVVEFVRRKAATLPGIACIVETGESLATLQTLSLSGAAVVSIDATWERVTVTDPTITLKRFGRVRVQIAP